MQKRQADMEEAYAAQVRSPRFARCAVSTRLGNAEPRPSRSFLTRPPPAAVGRRQRLAPPRLRPASQRERRRQGEPRDRGAPERHRQGTPRGHARHPEHRSIAVSKPNRREKTNRGFLFFRENPFLLRTSSSSRRSPVRRPRANPQSSPLAPMIRAPVQNDVRLIYKKIEEGADVNFVFGRAYGCPEGYTPLMSACHRGRLDAAKALLRSGADPNFMNGAGDLTLFWGVDGGVELIKLLIEYGVDLDARTPKDWTALSYAKAMGKYGLTTEKGIYPEDVLKFYGATEYGSGPEALGIRSPRESFNPAAEDFSRDRGSYQREPEHP